jgi:uncharacterized protein (TIGR03437 family)
MRTFARLAMIGFLLSVATPLAVGQNRIGVAAPGRAEIAGGVLGEVYAVDELEIFGSPAVNVKFTLDQVVTVGEVPTFLIVSPSSGTTPQRIRIGPNPHVIPNMRPGRYSASIFLTTVDQSPPVRAQAIISLTVRTPLPPNVGSTFNAASLQPMISPGGIVTIFGDSLGPPVLASEYDISGTYPTSFGNTTVTFNGVPAPLLYVSPGQINAVAPYAIAGQKDAEVIVSHYGQVSPAFSAPITDTAPAIFTSTPQGSTQGAPLNFVFPNYSVNSPDNPLALGGVIVLFATGAGVWDVQDTGISITAIPFTAKPVSLTIGGQPARILYAGVSPYQTNGMLQVNAFVPEGIEPGQQPVVLKIGQTDNATQQATISIK